MRLMCLRMTRIAQHTEITRPFLLNPRIRYMMKNKSLLTHTIFASVSPGDQYPLAKLFPLLGVGILTIPRCDWRMLGGMKLVEGMEHGRGGAATP